MRSLETLSRLRVRAIGPGVEVGKKLVQYVPEEMVNHFFAQKQNKKANTSLATICLLDVTHNKCHVTIMPLGTVWYTHDLFLVHEPTFFLQYELKLRKLIISLVWF